MKRNKRSAPCFLSSTLKESREDLFKTLADLVLLASMRKHSALRYKEIIAFPFTLALFSHGGERNKVQ